MKEFNIFLATLVLTAFAMYPASALADDLDDLGEDFLSRHCDLLSGW